MDAEVKEIIWILAGCAVLLAAMTAVALFVYWNFKLRKLIRDLQSIIEFEKIEKEDRILRRL